MINRWGITPILQHPGAYCSNQYSMTDGMQIRANMFFQQP